MRQLRRTRLLLTGTALFHLLTPHLGRLEPTLGGDTEHRRAHACPRERLPIAIVEAYVGVGAIMAAVVHLGPDVWRRRIAVRLEHWRRLARLNQASVRELAPTPPTERTLFNGMLTRVTAQTGRLRIDRRRYARLRRAGAPRPIRAAAAASPSAAASRTDRAGTDGRDDSTTRTRARARAQKASRDHRAHLRTHQRQLGRRRLRLRSRTPGAHLSERRVRAALPTPSWRSGGPRPLLL